VPTTRPRYTVTDTGEVREMLDLARRAWPDIAERKELLLLLAGEGRDAVKQRLDEADGADRRAAQRDALERAGTMLDTEALLGDSAWQ
jgi:hypothetical protein